MEANYNIVHLANGVNLVGDLEYTPDSVVIKFPLEVTAKPVTDDDGKIVGEHMVLRPFLVMTDDREVVIDQFNVICLNRLSERLYSSYEEMVENVYGKPVSFEGNFLKEDPKAKEIEELDDRELDYLQEQLDLIIDGKDKILH
jgi:hypothetical protein